MTTSSPLPLHTTSSQRDTNTATATSNSHTGGQPHAVGTRMSFIALGAAAIAAVLITAGEHYGNSNPAQFVTPKHMKMQKLLKSPQMAQAKKELGPSPKNMCPKNDASSPDDDAHLRGNEVITLQNCILLRETEQRPQKDL